MILTVTGPGVRIPLPPHQKWPFGREKKLKPSDDVRRFFIGC